MWDSQHTDSGEQKEVIILQKECGGIRSQGLRKDFLKERIEKRDGQRGFKEKKVKLKGLFLLLSR